MRRWQLFVSMLALAPPDLAYGNQHQQELRILRDALHWDASWGPEQRACRAYKDGETAEITDVKWGTEGWLIVPELACAVRTAVLGGATRTVLVTRLTQEWSIAHVLELIQGSGLVEPGASKIILQYSVRLPSLRQFSCRSPSEADRNRLKAAVVKEFQGYLGPESTFHSARAWIPRFCDTDPLVFVLARFSPGDEWLIVLFARGRSGSWGRSILSNSQDLAGRIERRTDEVLTIEEQTAPAKGAP